jgi:hypothetical protein
MHCHKSRVEKFGIDGKTGTVLIRYSARKIGGIFDANKNAGFRGWKRRDCGAYSLLSRRAWYRPRSRMFGKWRLETTVANCMFELLVSWLMLVDK